MVLKTCIIKILEDTLQAEGNYSKTKLRKTSELRRGKKCGQLIMYFFNCLKIS